jgi:hypothetical protein
MRSVSENKGLDQRPSLPHLEVLEDDVFGNCRVAPGRPIVRPQVRHRIWRQKTTSSLVPKAVTRRDEMCDATEECRRLPALRSRREEGGEQKEKILDRRSSPRASVRGKQMCGA